MRIEVRTQAELDAVKTTDVAVCMGDGYFVARGSSHVEARESSHVVARESSHVVASESSHVVARGAAQVIAKGYAKIVATAFVAVTVLSRTVSVEGGIQINPPDITSGRAWCDFYGVPVDEKGICVLYKAVESDWRGTRKTQVTYRPRSKPKAPDWDGGKRECGGGLHLSPAPTMAKGYCLQAVHYMACPVNVDDIAAHGFDAQYPDKVKVPGMARAIYEVDIEGHRMKKS